MNCKGCKYENEIFVAGDGNISSCLLIIGERPEAQELKAEKPFVGPAGRLLRRTLKSIGVADFFVDNAFPCGSSKDFDFDIAEKCFRSRHANDLENVKKVLILGRVAKTLFYRIPDMFPHVTVCFVNHPAWALRSGKIIPWKNTVKVCFKSIFMENIKK